MLEFKGLVHGQARGQNCRCMVWIPRPTIPVTVCRELARGSGQVGSSRASSLVLTGLSFAVSACRSGTHQRRSSQWLPCSCLGRMAAAMLTSQHSPGALTHSGWLPPPKTSPPGKTLNHQLDVSLAAFGGKSCFGLVLLKLCIREGVSDGAEESTSVWGSPVAKIAVFLPVRKLMIIIVT